VLWLLFNKLSMCARKITRQYIESRQPTNHAAMPPAAKPIQIIVIIIIAVVARCSLSLSRSLHEQLF
jgi:hypothetical protein